MVYGKRRLACDHHVLLEVVEGDVEQWLRHFISNSILLLHDEIRGWHTSIYEVTSHISVFVHVIYLFLFIIKTT